MIQCQICKILCVGQTKNKILQCINQHYSLIRNKLETPVARHMNSLTYRGNPPDKVCIVQMMMNTDNVESSLLTSNLLKICSLLQVAHVELLVELCPL